MYPYIRRRNVFVRKSSFSCERRNSVLICAAVLVPMCLWSSQALFHMSHAR